MQGNATIVTIDSGRGAHLHARRWLSEGARAGFLLVHGMESHSEWFQDVATRLSAAGATVLAFDRAGSGLSPARAGRFSAAAAVEDLRKAGDTLRADVAVVHLVGMSWGGLLALAAAADHAVGPLASVTLLAPSIFTKELAIRFKLQVASGLLFGRPAQIALPIAPEDFTGNGAKLTYVRRDPLRAKAASPAFLWETRRLQMRVRRLSRERTPKNAAVFLAEHDALISNEATLAFADAVGLDVRRFPGTRHSLVLEDPQGVAAALLGRAGLSPHV